MPGSITLHFGEVNVEAFLQRPDGCRLFYTIDDYTDPKIEKAWTNEIGRRVMEIESGKAKGIPAATVIAKARQALHETRRLSPARRK